MLDKLPHYCPVCAYHEVRVVRCSLVSPACSMRAVRIARASQPAVRCRQVLSLVLAPLLTLPRACTTLHAPAVEPAGPGGDDLRLPQAHTHLHQAQGCAPCAAGAAHPARFCCSTQPASGLLRCCVLQCV